MDICIIIDYHKKYHKNLPQGHSAIKIYHISALFSKLPSPLNLKL